MPIFVQWEWQERTKTFLVIFHFYDDYSKPNIRLKKKTFKDEGLEFERSTITWAPSHPELGLLSELLSYANIVNGLKLIEKRKLRHDLEIACREEGFLRLYWNPIDALIESAPHRLTLFEMGDVAIYVGRHNVKTLKKEKMEWKNFFFCVELCHEYIDYLKKALKPYLK